MSTKTILLIEDNVDDEQLVRRALQKNNVMDEVVVACDGESALDLLYPTSDSGKEPVIPDLIILDLHLPGISGLQVLQQLRGRAATKLTPVVIVTANEAPGQAEALYEDGANSFVLKPSDPDDFAEAFLNIAMYWLLLNVAPQAKAVAR